MRTSDFEIHNYKKLDKILIKLCEMVIDKHHNNPQKEGLVGAAVLDPKNNIVTGISTKSGDKWIHAERQALSKYQSKYGEVPEGSIIVTTLSPCNDVMGNRYSKSCTDLINQSPVKKVYCGYIDPTQNKNQRKFTQLETGNRKIREICMKISEIFLKNKSDFIKESQWKFARPANYDRALLSEALEEYFKKDGKWYPHRVDAAVTLIRHGGMILENGSQFADDYKQFTEYLKNIDHRNKVKISIGANVSVLQFWPYPGDEVLEVRGHRSPKEITDIHYDDDDNIEWILFADGSSFPDETFHDRGFGGELDYITTLFFNTKRDADNALLAAQLAMPDKWKMSTANLEENANLDEMALQQYTKLGNFEKQGPFTGVDKRLVPHPKNELKAVKFFEKTPYNFRLFFSNIPGTGKYAETGEVTPEQLEKMFGGQAQPVLDGSEDAITIIFVGNKGAEKVMLTPWMMAHRFGHAIQAGNYGKWSLWGEAETHFFSSVNNMLEQYYGKLPQRNSFSNRSIIKWDMSPEYNALFNAIGTQRSSRTSQIKRPYEFLYELFAQYLGTGQVVLNPLPTNLGYGRQNWGNPSKYLNLKPEYNDEYDRIEATTLLANDMEDMFDNVLSNSVGKIFVM